jgi:hypothetical protein
MQRRDEAADGRVWVMGVIDVELRNGGGAKNQTDHRTQSTVSQAPLSFLTVS